MIPLFIFVLPLYTRIQRSEVLDNENRRRIYMLVKERPGINGADLARASDLTRVVVQHHLRVLERHSFVVDRRNGRQASYFAAGVIPDPQLLRAACVLRDPTRRAIARAIGESKQGVTQRALAEATRVHPRLVSYHVARLAKEGHVSRTSDTPARLVPTRLLEVALGLPPTRERRDGPGPASS